MAQTTSGLRSLLSFPFAYRLFQKMVGAPRMLRVLTDEYIRARSGERLLDFGCGTAEILGYLPEVEYLGFDQNESYIRAAQKRFGPRGKFLGQDVNEVTFDRPGSFDGVLALGILHHLDDGEVIHLFRLARSCLKPSGRLITLDPCFEEGQSSIARFLIRRDRGQNTRTERGYITLASEIFSSVRSTVRHDLLNIPYTQVILACSP